MFSALDRDVMHSEKEDLRLEFFSVFVGGHTQLFEDQYVIGLC